MFSPITVLTILLSYFLVLFLLAQWVEGRSSLSKRVAGSPMVYGLSLAVYATSWTFYGSVGKAVTSGMLFTTVYIGPTLMIILWWQIMRRMVRIKHRYRITSIADFISARYDRSPMLAAMAACAALLGITPYIALQLRSVVATFSIIVGDTGQTHSWLQDLIGPVAVFLMTTFTIIFGVRRLDPTERHQGMITAVAVQSVIKLFAFLACGVFVTFIVHSGFEDMVRNTRAMGIPIDEVISLSGPTESPYSTWATYLILSMSAIMFLPRQFHVTVVENSDERHLTSAMWILPLYLLLISVFVIPIALEGVRIGFPSTWADTFVLRLPMWHDKPWLTMFVYIGGVSAAVSMVMISSMTLSTMMVNHILLPVIRTIPILEPLRRRLLTLRWLSVVVVILTGYWFESMAVERFLLVNMGMISFAAALQFAPSILGGLFWQRGNKSGALAGLMAGFSIWLYTLVLPTLSPRSETVQAIVKDGLFGLEYLRPEGLLGMSVLDPLSQGVFWSMLLNISLYVGFSLMTRQTSTGVALAQDFVHIMDKESESTKQDDKPTINLMAKASSIIDTLTRYVPESDAKLMFANSLDRTGLQRRQMVSLTELTELLSEVEKSLAGAVGAAEAHMAVVSTEVYTEEEREKLSNMYANILADLKLTPGELKKRVDYYREREAMMSEQADELKRRAWSRFQEVKTLHEELKTLSLCLAHHLRLPLHNIDDMITDFHEQHGEELSEESREQLERIRQTAEGLERRIDDLLDLTALATRPLERTEVDLSAMALDVVEALHAHMPEPHVNAYIAPHIKASADVEMARMIMGTLLGNAWTCSQEQAQPSIAFQTEVRDGATWFMVRDNGAPFDATSKQAPICTLSRLNQDKFSETSLDMTIVARAIRRHGGKIMTEQGPEGEAAFFFTLDEEPDEE